MIVIETFERAGRSSTDIGFQATMVWAAFAPAS
jgi:hypothetical protein